jgi:PAS domain S-box-containing protein
MTSKVLLVEDNPGHAHLLREMLARTAPGQFDLTHVQRLSAAIQCLERDAFDLVLLDLSLPDSLGFETFERLHAQAPDAPVIVLSGFDDESLAVRAVREGAQDYLVKGQVDGNLLARAMRYAIERAQTEALTRAQRDLGLALGGATSLDQVLRLCVETAIRVSGMDCGGVYLEGKEPDSLRLAYHQGFAEGFVRRASYYTAGTDQVRLVMAGKPVYFLYQKLNFSPDDPGMREGLRALAVIPVYHEGRIIACMNVASHTLEQVPVSARNALEIIATQVGSVIARVQAEAELRKFKTISDNANYGVIIADMSGNILYVNDCLAAMHGYEVDELLGQNLTIFHGQRHVQDILDANPAIMQTGSYSGEVQSIRKDGSTFPALMHGSAIRAPGGELLFLTTTVIDISQRKRAEEQLKHYADELEHSNQELQQFAHVASHDLQEPLRMVSSYLRLLEQRCQGQLDEAASEYIAFAVDGAARMQALIRDLLAYSRVGTHGEPFEPTDCQAVLEQVLQDLKVTLEESGAVITHDPLPVVRGDATQLGQLLQNLISNAIKFRGQRPPEIHVGVERRGDEWVFAVRDNGIGIEEQYFERIFLVFQRLHTQAEYPGTGIGLAVCKRIVERHGGRIWVESEPGQGATFYFTLPDQGV